MTIPFLLTVEIPENAEIRQRFHFLFENFVSSTVQTRAAISRNGNASPRTLALVIGIYQIDAGKLLHHDRALNAFLFDV
jgi:hypothetical protein